MSAKTIEPAKTLVICVSIFEKVPSPLFLKIPVNAVSSSFLPERARSKSPSLS
ncbi:MAG: hypothetical protein NC913_03280 [Candidatus Omnitrophica bacterium]|nr:hypothetical protein [Candidatus Omnitrophota bacterium]